MKTLILSILMTTQLFAEESKFFRFWQGYKKPGMTNDVFLEKLSPFLQGTVDVYGGKGLVNYLVFVPPINKPAFIPDEFALVALDNEESYRKVRATPEGKAYGDSHWEIFDKNISKSAEVKLLTPDIKSVEFNVAYNVLGKPLPLTGTYNTFFIGKRVPKLTDSHFQTRMAEHLRLVQRSFESKGLVGYVILTHRNYEVAYLTWKSKQYSEAAFASAEGKAVVADTATLLETVAFEEARPIPNKVEAGNYYQAYP